MSTIGRLMGAVLLMAGLGASALGCSNPVPGIIETPPCSVAQPAPDDSTAPDQTKTSPPSVTVELSTLVEEALVTLLLF